MKDAYFLKMLYFNAGKNLLADNYNFFNNLVSYARTDSLSEKILQIEKSDFCCTLHDKAGAAAGKVLQTLTEKLYCEKIVFTYIDDELPCVPMAVFIPGNNMFIYNDKWNLFPCLLRFNLSGCYHRTEGRKYSSRQYLEAAKDFFEKSECIDNILSL